MTRTIDATPTAAVTIADPTIGFRRRVGAIALPTAFALQAGTNALYAWATRNGGGDTGTGAETLAFYADHAQEMTVATVASLVGSLLVIPGILAALRVLRRSRPRLSLSAGILMIAGYVCYFGIVFTNFDVLALGTAGVDAGAAMEATQANPVAVPFFLVFVAGNLIGTLLLGLAVILSRDLPWWAGALILGWPVGHVTNLVVGNEWFAVAGGALEVVGLAILALAALRMTDAEWSARG